LTSQETGSSRHQRDMYSLKRDTSTLDRRVKDAGGEWPEEAGKLALSEWRAGPGNPH
jgi:hypothetical protein